MRERESKSTRILLAGSEVASGNPNKVLPGDATTRRPVVTSPPRYVRVTFPNFLHDGRPVEFGDVIACNATDAANLVLQKRAVYADPKEAV